jgi:hypothetical protein
VIVPKQPYEVAAEVDYAPKHPSSPMEKGCLERGRWAFYDQTLALKRRIRASRAYFVSKHD